MDLLESKQLLNREFEEVEVKTILEDQIVGLYFSASWCPPCQQFVEVLAKTHKELRKRNSSFQVVFLSSDKTVEDMQQFVTEKHGDWYMLPFGDPTIQELQDKFEVTMIPKLIILRPDGEVITTKGRKEIQDRGVAAFGTWKAAVDHAEAQQKLLTDNSPLPTLIFDKSHTDKDISGTGNVQVENITKNTDSFDNEYMNPMKAKTGETENKIIHENVESSQTDTAQETTDNENMNPMKAKTGETEYKLLQENGESSQTDSDTAQETTD